MSETLIHLLLGLCICLPIIVIVLRAVKLRGAKHTGVKKSGADIGYLLQRHTYDIAVYAFAGNISGIDDINAMRVSHYRDYGQIQSYGEPFYELNFVPSEATVFDLGNILMHAKEVRRMDEVRTLYFFADHIVRSTSDEHIKEIQHAIKAKMRDGHTVMMIIDKHIVPDDNSKFPGES